MAVGGVPQTPKCIPEAGVLCPWAPWPGAGVWSLWLKTHQPLMAPLHARTGGEPLADVPHSAGRAPRRRGQGPGRGVLGDEVGAAGLRSCAVGPGEAPMGHRDTQGSLHPVLVQTVPGQPGRRTYGGLSPQLGHPSPPGSPPVACPSLALATSSSSPRWH